jgi:L-lactate utilization protein LutB
MVGRRVLREKFRQADMGITGANFAVSAMLRFSGLEGT